MNLFLFLKRSSEIILGIAFALAVGSQVLNFALPIPVIAIVFLALFFLGLFISRFLIQRLIIPHFRNLSKSAWFLSACGAILVGLFLAYQLPLTIYPKLDWITIVATGDKNPLSNGSEVWLVSVIAGRKAPALNPLEICSGDGWVNKDGVLVSFQNQPAMLNCVVKSDDFVIVNFNKHAWSGKVSVSTDDQVKEADLYSEKGSEQESINLPIELGPIRTSVRLVFWLADGIWIGLLLGAAGLWFVKRPVQLPLEPMPASLAWYWYALPMFVAWLLYLIAFWPGFTSPDVITQWKQIITGEFTDWHPVFHTWTLWLITRFWFSPAAIALVQIAVFSVVIGWGLSLIQRWNSPAWLPWLLVGYFTFSPAIGLMAISIWKDSAYSILVLLLTLLILEIVVSDGSSLKRAKTWILLGISAALISLYRHNGFPVAFGSLICLLFFYPRNRKTILWSLLLSIGIILFVRIPLFRLADVKTDMQELGKNLAPEISYFVLDHWHYQNGTPFTPEEIEFIEEQPWHDAATFFQYNAKNSNELRKLALKLTIRNPLGTLKFLMEKSSYIFQISQPSEGRIGFVELAIPPNSFGLSLGSKSFSLQNLLTRLTSISELPAVNWFFWRNAFWMYVCIFATIIACFRVRSWKYLLLNLPILMNALPLIILSGGQIYRYISSTLMVGPILSVFLVLIAQPRNETQRNALRISALYSALNIRSNMQAFIELLALLTRHRQLTLVMAKREITDRYAGQFFGIFWTFIHPLILIMVYIFLFKIVFVTRIGGTNALPLDMTAYIMAGIIPWLAFSDVLGKSSTVIINHANLVKQVIFPIEVLPVKGVLSSLFTQLIFIILLFIYTLITSGNIWMTYLLLPVLLFFQMLAMIGTGYILSSIGTYMRDIKDFVQVFITLGLWFIPIFYLPEAIPAAVRPILYINPFTYMIWCFQDVFYFGRIEHPIAWIVFPLLSLLVFIFGYRLFRKLKVMFGNVL